MASLNNSLQNLSTFYTVFEKDQLLTAPDLNSGISYLDNQERLTRVELIGVGIVAGLKVSSTGSAVLVTKGLGVTTDGDLLMIGADTTYTSFKPYGATAPSYAPFGSGATMIPAWELIADGAQDPDATPLTQFQATTSSALGDMALVFLASTFAEDQDDCVGTDCDNLGQKAVHDQKLILIQKTAAGPFKESADKISTPDLAAQGLDDVVADRPVLAGVTTTGQLFAAYQTACGGILAKLTGALPKIFPACRAFIGDLYPSDPAPGWISKLQKALAQYGAVAGVQYVYDLFKDFVETYQAFREQLFGDTTVTLPPFDAFSKHLLLGDVVPSADPGENRTGHYPSPAVASRGLEHARFLAGKLEVLVDAFALPTGSTPIRITPSLGEDRSLEERAIPYYYNPKTTPAISDSWSFELARRHMGAFNYSYNADQYGGRGGAASPLTAPIGRFSFFRIEGHLGASAATAISFLQGEARNKNLPFSIHAVLVETDKTKIVRWFPPIYSDLNRVHRVFRNGLADQLYNASNYADTLMQKVNASSADQNVKMLANTSYTDVKTNAARAAGKLHTDYVTFQKDASWRDDLGNTQQSAAQFKQTLTDVAKTEFTTPFDSLIGTPPEQFLGWLDTVIQAKQDKADDKHLVSTFLDKHNGLEHAGGVMRGGTFVLAYDTTGVVVGDFMLPYRHATQDDPEIEQPTTTTGPLISTWPSGLFEKAITLGQPLETAITNGVQKFWNDVSNPAIDARFKAQEQFVSLFTDVLPKLAPGAAQTTQPSQTTTPGQVFKDPNLGFLQQELDLNNAKLDFIRAQFVDASRNPGGPSADLTAQLKAAESDLGATVTKVVTYAKTSSQDLAVGSEGFAVVQAASESAQKVNNTSVKSTLTRNLNKVSTGASAGLKAIIGSIATR